MEENIKNAFLKKYPNWKNDDFNIFIEEELPDYTMGTITWEKHGGKAFWLAVKINNQWLIANHSGGGYFGVCQDFAKYNFPPEMTPDCWDEEQRILINTPNPDRFYNSLTIKDKEKIKQAFLDFKKDDVNFQDKKIYVKFNEIMGNYLRGVILIGGIENHSAPHFFAVKSNDNWKVLYYGQEDPPCENIEGYNFPVEMVSGCWRAGNNWIER
ncbi:MAG: hypothetical protein U9R14_02535 [Patescibacteria group bacterium]|nr:hypothetical protein [Patescibacteria group bacterium]